MLHRLKLSSCWLITKSLKAKGDDSCHYAQGSGGLRVRVDWFAMVGHKSQGICGTHVKMVASDNIYIYIYRGVFVTC